MKGLSYGAELELPDIPRHIGLPEGCGWDRSDPTMVNSNGIAVDPKGKTTGFGGEVQTRPTPSIKGQVDVFQEVADYLGFDRVNFRSNLHIHVHVPGLANNLPLLKRFQRVIHEELPPVLLDMEPIPEPTPRFFPVPDALEGALKRRRRRKRSHQMFLPAKRLANQLRAKTLAQFFDREVPATKDGKPMYHAQARCCVNLRQLKQTDTIEFRHFPGTANAREFHDSLWWCDAFVRVVLNKGSVQGLWEILAPQIHLPTFARFQYHIECPYLKTTHNGSVPKAQIPEAIREELASRPKILAVCLGNINRSPSITAVLRKKGYPTKSAGFSPRGSSATKRTTKIMESLGYDLKGHRPRRLSKGLCHWADVILVTTEKHKRKAQELFPESHKKVQCLPYEIQDPEPMKDASKVQAVLERLVWSVGVFLDARLAGYKVQVSQGFGLCD